MQFPFVGKTPLKRCFGRAAAYSKLPIAPSKCSVHIVACAKLESYLPELLEELYALENRRGNLANYFVPQKPEFPAQGQELQCPNCSTKTKYQRTDLRYDSK
jgi:hypothetical protein